MKWHIIARITVLIAVFGIVLSVAWFATNLCGYITKVNFQTTLDKDLWNDWNRIIYLSFSGIGYMAFVICAWYHRSSTYKYEKRKNSRKRSCFWTIVIMMVLSILPILICALLNPYLKSGQVVEAHAAYILAPLALSIILLLFIYIRDGRGIIEW